ncbi:hypothetical protein [Flavobacterium salmonis]|uniref:Lipoprotein n=1 Tax=Flavobacterium salmonis TaxID=2654844 RepID=A0A6V6Z746_9FLAO|nr:hypothetical protein [Flavobacterium salmonis]CAD0007603.1 hypothetical protein FLAT13_03926 [Flavobacterium salmonis]
MKKYILAFCIISILISCGHTLDSKVKSAVDILSKETSINTSWPQGNDDFKNLLKVATIEDLLYLTENENVNIRYYSFIGLKEKNYPKIKEMYYKFQKDYEAVYTNNGACLKGISSLNDLIFFELNPQHYKSKYGFTQKEFDKIGKKRYDKVVGD